LKKSYLKKADANYYINGYIEKSKNVFSSLKNF